MVPLLVTASAGCTVVAASNAPAQIKRRFLFIFHPPEVKRVPLPHFIYAVQDVSPA
jgi:hypothetical protein